MEQLSILVGRETRDAVTVWDTRLLNAGFLCSRQHIIHNIGVKSSILHSNIGSLFYRRPNRPHHFNMYDQ